MTTKRRRKKLKVEGELELQQDKVALKCDIKPRTENQRLYIETIIKNEITFCSGPAGSGKSYLAVYFACTCLAKGLVDKIILTRPLVNCGNGLGWLGGMIEAKVHPYLVPLTEACIEFLGSNTYNRLLKEKVIEIVPLELCRGRSFHNTCLVADEMQNATYEQIKMLLTRHGQTTKSIYTCDPRQTDLDQNDFNFVMKKLENVEGLGIAKLERSDIQRSGIIAKILEKLED